MKRSMKGPINQGIRTPIKMALRYLLILALCTGFGSCKSQKTQTIEDGSLILLVQETYSGIDTSETIIAQDQKTLNGFYAKINKTRKPGLPAPKLDFSKDMAIVVCMGQQKGNDLPILVKTKEDANSIIFQVKLNKTGHESSNTLISTPFCIYKIPLTSREIVFSKD